MKTDNEEFKYIVPIFFILGMIFCSFIFLTLKVHQNEKRDNIIRELKHHIFITDSINNKIHEIK